MQLRISEVVYFKLGYPLISLIIKISVNHNTSLIPTKWNETSFLIMLYISEAVFAVEYGPADEAI